MPWRLPPIRSLPSKRSLQYVSGNFFQGLGAVPVLGRPFRDDEDRVGGEPVVIVSHRFWVNRLGGGSDALDRTVRVNNVSARIVGVAPPGFFGLRPGQWPDIYAPLAMKVAFQPRRSGGVTLGEDDRNWWVRQVGRLKPGISETAARTRDRRPLPEHAGSRRHQQDSRARHLAGPSWLRCAERQGYQSPVDSDAAGRRAAAHRLRQRGESAAVALGRQAARVGRASGARSGTNAALPAASDREWSPGAPGRRGGTGVGIRAGAIDPRPVSVGPRCEQRLRPPCRSARPGIHRCALDPDRAPLWPRTGRAGRARRPQRHAQSADADR